MYHHNHDYELIIESPKIFLKVHYYMFDIKKHDILFVQHVFKLHWNFLKLKGCQLR